MNSFAIELTDISFSGPYLKNCSILYLVMLLHKCVTLTKYLSKQSYHSIGKNYILFHIDISLEIVVTEILNMPKTCLGCTYT